MKLINSERPFRNFRLLMNIKPKGIESPLDHLFTALVTDKSGMFGENAIRSTPGYAFEQMQDLWIHCPVLPKEGTDLERYQTYAECVENVWYRGYQELPFVKHFIYSLAQAVDASEIGRVTISRLRPGCVMKAHYDSGHGNEEYIRFHLAIYNTDGMEFRCGEGNDEESFVARSGDVFYFRNDKLHSVHNTHPSETRLAMVIDLRTSWVKSYKDFADFKRSLETGRPSEEEQIKDTIEEVA